MKVTFNGRRKFKMFFDTGASSTPIAMPAAQTLGL
ncbi:retroviral-like aspartic protease family protein [Kamptonema formosum]